MAQRGSLSRRVKVIRTVSSLGSLATNLHTCKVSSDCLSKTLLQNAVMHAWVGQDQPGRLIGSSWLDLHPSITRLNMRHRPKSGLLAQNISVSLLSSSKHPHPGLKALVSRSSLPLFVRESGSASRLVTRNLHAVSELQVPRRLVQRSP